MLKLGELGEVSFGILKLGELAELSFGQLKLCELRLVLKFWSLCTKNDSLPQCDTFSLWVFGA